MPHKKPADIKDGQHMCPECLETCGCQPGTEDIRECQHDPCDIEVDFSDDEAQYNYED